MAGRRFIKSLLFIAIPGAAIAALVVLWNWDWFIPIVEGRASSMLGRQLSIEHLHVRLGRITTASADNVRIANPLDFPEPGDFARIARLSVHADVMAYLRSREIVLPEVVLGTARTAGAADRRSEEQLHPVTRNRWGCENWRFAHHRRPGACRSSEPEGRFRVGCRDPRGAADPRRSRNRKSWRTPRGPMPVSP